MSAQLAEVLKALHIERKKEAPKSGQGEIIETIFHRNGGHIEQNFIRRVYKRLLTKAGLREIRLHDMCHTFASLLLSDGVPIFYVSKQLRHASIRMTVDIYGHLIPSDDGALVNRLDTQPAATCSNRKGVTI